MRRNRAKTLVECHKCKDNYEKRTDTLKDWSGLCYVCSNKKKVNEKIKGTRRVFYNLCKCCSKESKYIKKSELCQTCFSARKGEDHHNWIKDRSTLAKKQERNDSAYKEWRMSVWKRDNFICQLKDNNCCNKIEVHHIYEWSKYEELRYDINNGITLCKIHHPRKREQVLLLVNIFNNINNLKN